MVAMMDYRQRPVEPLGLAEMCQGDFVPMIKKRALALCLTAAAALLPLARAQAQTSTTYSDNAANYSSSYGGSNSGTGFGMFNVSVSGVAGTFLGTASQSESGQGDNGAPAPGSIDTGGKSFGFYANSGAGSVVTVSRAFTNSLTNLGDSFSLDFVTGYNDSGTAGVSLINSSGQVAALNYAANTGFTFNGGTGVIAGYASGAIHLTYTLTSPTTVQLQATGAVNTTQTATFNGSLTGFQVYQTNSGGNTADHNGYFNNLSYTITSSDALPEPGDLALLTLGVGMLGIAARRRFAKS